MRIFRKIKSSVFLKLGIILIAFVVLVNSLTSFFVYFSLERDPLSMLHRYPVLLNKYVIQDVGIPPDTVKARELSRELNLNIRYELNNFYWATDESMAGAEEILKQKNSDTSKSFSRYKSRLYSITKVDNGYITISPWLPRDFANTPKAIIAVICFFTIVIIFLYFALRWLLSPVKILSKGVEELSKGKLDYRIDLKSKDEFGKLAGLINNMTENIQSSMKAKETLLVDVSHELRTPLTRMKLSSEFIENEKIKKRVKEDVNEMEHMVGELLDNYKKENALSKPEISEFDLRELIENTSEKFTTERIKIKTSQEKLVVRADKKKIELVIKNLLDNALKYSKDNVEVKAEDNPVNTNGFILKVTDKGTGIPAEEIKYIFEPFYRVDKSRNKVIAGYGLGLSIVKKIVEAHNGTIEVKSEKDKGTEFIVKI
jgi:signal transduction histidine kinase